MNSYNNSPFAEHLNDHSMVGNIQMVITDLDGTLFNDDRIISVRDYDTLAWLGEQKITRVIATGRNL